MKFADVTYFIALGLCAVAVQANAQIYKCVDPKSGAKTYSDSGCGARARISTIERAPTAKLSAPEATQATYAAPSTQDRSGSFYRGGAQTTQTTHSAPVESMSSLRDARNNEGSFECEQARRKLAVRQSRKTRFESDAREEPIDIAAACGYSGR